MVNKKWGAQPPQPCKVEGQLPPLPPMFSAPGLAIYGNLLFHSPYVIVVV